MLPLIKLYSEGNLAGDIGRWLVGITIIIVILMVFAYTLWGLFGPRIKDYKKEVGKGWFWKGLWHEVFPGFGRFFREISWKDLILYHDVEPATKRHKLQAWTYGIFLAVILFALYIAFWAV